MSRPNTTVLVCVAAALSLTVITMAARRVVETPSSRLADAVAPGASATPIARRTLKYYQDNPEQLDADTRQCRDDAGHAAPEIDCRIVISTDRIRAFQGTLNK